ncbi:uncharacterized protein [Ambystoma mexicanum]|uniref:uncharacterized protein n=1 Tax=Ambystoma mexicanum TaxID=8296 RepID=UPI0037E77E96
MCEFLKEEITFSGYVFNRNGVSPDPLKVVDIKGASPPITTTEVRSFLGMANYCNRFTLNLVTISKSLRELTKANIKWDWNTRCQDAFKQIKTLLSADTTMACYDATL